MINVQDQVQQILLSINQTIPNDIPQELNLFDSGLIDSLGIFDLINQVEKVFQIKIDGSDLVSENFCSVSALTTLLNKYVSN